MKTLAIGTIFTHFNVNIGKNVKLKVVKVKIFDCAKCYFHQIDTYCPDEYACSKNARTDKTSINFRKTK